MVLTFTIAFILVFGGIGFLVGRAIRQNRQNAASMIVTLFIDRQFVRMGNTTAGEINKGDFRAESYLGWLAPGAELDGHTMVESIDGGGQRLTTHVLQDGQRKSFVLEAKPVNQS